MDTDKFQKFSLPHLDFNGDLTPNNKTPRPYEIKKSSSFETLLEQNEETLTKFKISLRKQSRLEEEIQKLTEEVQRLADTNKSLVDEIYILRENESNAKVQIHQLEQTLDVQEEKLALVISQLDRSQTENQRHQKYQDKIKNQVRPYLQQLKEYARSLEEQIQQSEKKLNYKETQVRELRAQMSELSKNTRAQIEVMEQQHQESLEAYESQLETLKSDMQTIKGEAEALVLKNFKLQKSFDRQVELENQLIEMSRAKELQKEQLESEVLRVQEKNNEYHRENQKLQIEHADLQQRVRSDSERIQEFEKAHYDMQHQLESLRYMWNAKNEENEKVKLAMQALEKLNLDLSLKVQELRSGAAATNAMTSVVDSTL